MAKSYATTVSQARTAGHTTILEEGKTATIAAHKRSDIATRYTVPFKSIQIVNHRPMARSPVINTVIPRHWSAITIVSILFIGLTSLLSSASQARVLSDLEYIDAWVASNDKGVTEKERQCDIAMEIIKATGDESPCSPEDLAYGARVLASYRAAIAAVQDSEFSPNDYGAVASSQSRADLNEPMADQAACAVAISDDYRGDLNHLRLPTHPPSCSDDMVAYGMRLIRDYQKAINAEGALP